MINNIISNILDESENLRIQRFENFFKTSISKLKNDKYFILKYVYSGDNENCSFALDFISAYWEPDEAIASRCFFLLHSTTPLPVQLSALAVLGSWFKKSNGQLYRSEIVHIVKHSPYKDIKKYAFFYLIDDCDLLNLLDNNIDNIINFDINDIDLDNYFKTKGG